MKVILAITILAVAIRSSSQDACADHANGCSIPYDLPYFYKNQFTPSCNRHDVCYACGNQLGLSRKHCDDMFLSRMKTVCSQISKRILVGPSDVKQAFCNVVKTSYYEAVRFGGAKHFNTGHQAWCTEGWVSSCL